MQRYKIAVIPGDGIGPEVVAEGIKALECAARLDGRFGFDFTYFPWGCEYWLESGHMMPDDGLDLLRGFDAIFLGAVGFPGVPDSVSLPGLLLKIRKGFDQYINLRPIRLLHGVRHALADAEAQDINMIFVRENSEGEYAGTGRRENVGTPDERAVQEAVFTRRGCERVMRYAFELAREHNKKLTSISKGNALGYSMVFWDEIFKQLSSEYPDVKTETLLVDAAAMFMVKQPSRFQIVVASNLFGDILTDLGAAIAGGMGFAAGANLNPGRSFPSMFEPVHGSAPDIAGKGLANPFAAIWAASQMLDHLGRADWGARFICGIEAMLAGGKVLTPDLGGSATTSQVGDAFINRLSHV